MSELRTVRRIATAFRTLEGAGFEVQRPFPTPELDFFDPFLLLDEMGPVEVPPGQAKGAPDHPHRGFETVTYVLAGRMEHRDSRGHAGGLGPGDVQWMTAGSGVVHSEMPAREFQETGGRMHGFQLWVNLPQRDKMIAPRYQEIPATEIPTVETEDGRVRVRVVAGTALGRDAVIETRTPILYQHFTIEPGATFDQPVPSDFNVFAYIIDGAGTFGADDEPAHDAQMVMFEADGDEVRLTAADGDTLDLLLIGGVPLDETVVRYGPFVMNTREEIIEAIHDFQSGKMGAIE